MSRAALAAGAHGLLIEVVASEAERAHLRCDASQGITPDVLAEIVALTRDMVVPGITPEATVGAAS
jgi:3-deoxy-D-arabino-heptulosonate 7-phosphate (DAHP) synthase